MEAMLIPIILFLCAAAVLIVWITTRYRERVAMVEKGLGSEEIKAMYARDIKRDPLASLKWGILFVVAGIAVMLGGVLHEYFRLDGGITVGMVGVFIGAGLLLFYGIATKKIKAK